ncbi:LysR family transcriptional regulator [Streptomyces sp. NPDC051555]|uniref:LysR family transcriptional regulator n=1 Tax=Streptomyces sp. NPDC051555 TaxID=3365657 RepID=UPI0037B6335F
MDLVGHVRSFVAVAEERHFGRAAARLGMAQPPLSQRIQRLEKELGLRLFERTSRQVTLTQAGALLLPEARDLITGCDALLGSAARIRDGHRGLLRAALPPGVGAATVAAILTELRERHPGLDVELHELPTADQLARLVSHDLDVGLIHHPCDVTGLELGPLLRCELGVLLPPSSPLAERTEVPLAALTGHGLVLFPRADAPALYDDMLTTCARDGYTPEAIRHGQGDSFVEGLILSVNAVAFSPAPPRAPTAPTAPTGPTGPSGSDVLWRPLAGAPLTWRYSAAWPRGRGSASVSAFADAVPGGLRHTTVLSDTPSPRPLHLRPASEYWL